MSGYLNAKTIVVIGGTTGIGLSGARACAAEGANVVIVGLDGDGLRRAFDELHAEGLDAVGFAADATDPSVASRAIELAEERFGTFDGLYHVAGGSGRRMGDGPLHEITDDGWRATLDLNLTSMFNSNRAAVRQFLKRKTGGSVLNVGSVLATSPSPGHFATHAYAAAKSAAIGFTRSCAAYYAKDNVRFNVIAPGLVATPMSRRAVNDPAIADLVRRKQPLDGGRVGRPDDLDEAVVYFLSNASWFVTGQVLNVDGGWSVSDGTE